MGDEELFAEIVRSAEAIGALIHEDSAAWQPCSYIARLSTSAGQTTGLIDSQGFDTIKTFCISGTRLRPPAG